MNRESISVTALNRYVKSLLESDEVLSQIWVEGEISGFKLHTASGHMYFRLIDKHCSVKCVMFYGYASKLKFMPEEGDSLIVTAFTKSNGAPVSYAYFTTGVTMNEYTQIEAQFDNPLSACDSLCIIIVAGGFQTHENTTLIVDDVTLNYSNVAVEDHQKKSFAIFPNPAVDQLTIQSPEGRFNYQLHDLTGRLLLSGNGEGQEMISVSALPAGAYMLRLQSDSQIITKKVIIR